MPNKVIAALVLVALLSLSGARAGLAAVDAGEVLTMNGDCFAVAGDQRAPLKMGDVVHAGDVIEVPEGARLKLRMTDGSVLSLASGTRMTIQTYDVDATDQKRDAKLQLDTGLLRAVVNKISQPSTFEVSTATGVAAARSTDWFVEADPEAMRVGVLDGTVSLAALDAKGVAAANGVLIPANSGSEIETIAAPTPPVETKPGAAPPRPARRLAPQSVKQLTRSDFDRLIDRTNIRFGWCQCIENRTIIKADCQTSAAGCKADCGGGNFAYVPNARQSCARFYVDVVTGRGPRR